MSASGPRIGWIDATAGASGDMLLGALIGAGVPVEVLRSALASVSAVGVEPIELRVEDARRGGLAATRCRVDAPTSQVHRRLDDIEELLRSASLEAQVRDQAIGTFRRIADAESEVHGVALEEVHFHEVGALDAIADVVAVCAGLAHLGLDEVVVSTVGVGSGQVSGAHGVLPVPPPAVARLLLGVPSTAGPATTEACTPTGAALLTQWASDHGPQPTMSVEAIGVGAGGRDPDTHANVTRILIGRPLAQEADQVLLETNVDDLDPRLWPEALAALLAAGAVDAWLTPIVMKKGRPAHTLGVLVPHGAVEPVRTAVFTHTTAIGLREIAVSKVACERRFVTVTVEGHPVRIKVASWAGREVNAQPEYDDAATTARALGRPVGEVLAAAATAYATGRE